MPKYNFKKIKRILKSLINYQGVTVVEVPSSLSLSYLILTSLTSYGETKPFYRFTSFMRYSRKEITCRGLSIFRTLVKANVYTTFVTLLKSEVKTASVARFSENL